MIEEEDERGSKHAKKETKLIMSNGVMQHMGASTVTEGKGKQEEKRRKLLMAVWFWVSRFPNSHGIGGCHNGNCTVNGIVKTLHRRTDAQTQIEIEMFFV